MKSKFIAYTIKKIILLIHEVPIMHKAILIAQEIYKNFIQGQEKIIVLNDINVTFIQGKSYAITGTSGSGKSTLIHILAGLDTPTNGKVLFNNQAIHTFSIPQRCQFRNQAIGLVFQSPHLIRELSVLENIILPGLISGKNKNDCIKRAEKLLEKVNLFSKKDQKPGELSGGQQQRVAIARALFNEPKFLIADEPTGNLDLTTRKDIIDLILSCQQQWGMGIIISSHDEYVTQRMEHVFKLHKGTLG